MHTMHTMHTLTITLAPTTTGSTVYTTIISTPDGWNEYCSLSAGASAGIGIASLFIICATIVALV